MNSTGLLPEDVPSNYFSPSFKVSVPAPVSTLIVTSDGERLLAAIGSSIHEYSLDGQFIKAYATAVGTIDTFVLCENESALIALVNSRLYRLNFNDATPSLVPVSFVSANASTTTEPIQHLIKSSTYLYKTDAVSNTDDSVFFSTPRGIYQYQSSVSSPRLFIDHSINETIQFGKGLLVTKDHVYRSFAGGVAQWSRSSGITLNNFLSNLTTTTPSSILLLQSNILFSEKQGFWDITNGRFISQISDTYKVNAGIVGAESLFVAAEGYQYARQYRSLRGVWKPTSYSEERNCTAANFRHEYTGCSYITALTMINTDTFIASGNGSICIYRNLYTLGPFLFCGKEQIIMSPISNEFIIGFVGGAIAIIFVMSISIYSYKQRRKRAAREVQRRARELEASLRKTLSGSLTDLSFVSKSCEDFELNSMQNNR